MKRIYLIGSLRNPRVPEISKVLRAQGYEVFDSWYAVGPKADDHWRDYEKAKGVSYSVALRDYAATHTFEFDKLHLDRSDIVVLVMPAGRSGHIELGYAIGKGKLGFILFESEPERWDVMYRFATEVVFSVDDLLQALRGC